MTSAPSQAQSDDDLQDSFGLRDLAWDGQSRLTAVILGLDRRPAEGDSILTRTDVIIVASIYPAQGTISLLHIPRDVYMNIPNTSDFIQVNTLLQDGDAMMEGYGPYWVADVLQYNLGIYIDRYVMVDFEAFITIVDALGGISITTGYPISDTSFPDMNYGYDPFVLPAGTHQLNGYNALRFARTRHQDNDYVRGSRQIQVLEAILDRLQEPGILPRLIVESPNLLRSVNQNVYTDIWLEDAFTLARYAILIPRENVLSSTLEREYTMDTIVNGRRVVIPNPSSVHRLMLTVFGADYDVTP
jgi:LCP family protein required for cell wall assembly